MKSRKKNREPEALNIVIDQAKNLVFKSEKELLEYFKKEITAIETEYRSLRGAQDFTELEVEELSALIDQCLEIPDTVWRDESTFERQAVYYFIKEFQKKEDPFWYVAAVYLDVDIATFIFFHFATKSLSLVENFKRGELVFDIRQELYESACIEGDALTDADPLALGLFQSMMKVRSDKDISLDKFSEFAKFREECIETADEIWRSQDLQAPSLVTFIKDFPDQEGYPDLTYIVVTQEDEGSAVHSLLFSFPTVDKSLAERYRHGENLQADEVMQESSH
jgi:hypothetical protein